MKNHKVLLLLGLSAISIVHAQDAPPAKTLASTMDVFVFPQEGQETDQQSKDEAACYEWATSNTGNDPFDLQKQSVAQAEQTEQQKAEAQKIGQGAGAAGAVKGAAAGAIIGEIADDNSSHGAKVGAGVGVVRGRRKAKAAQAQAAEQAEQQGQAKQEATAEQLENFKKAFSVCLEAKDYLVKF